jgi:hypothetical protein
MIRHLPLLFLLVIPALARNDAKGLGIRVFAAAAHKDQPKVRVIAGKEVGEPFELPVYNLSDPLTVKSRDLRFINEGTDPAAAGDGICRVRLPDAGSDFRILLVPRDKETYQPFVVRGDDPEFGSGDVFFINMSSEHIVGLLGTAKLDLKPGKQDIVRLAGAKSNVYFEVKIATRKEDEFIPLADTRWPVMRNNRSFLVFYNGPNGRPAYRAVDEFLPPG